MNDLDPRMFGDDQPCFGCSPSNPVGLHLQFERDGDNAVTSTFHAKPGWEGAPGVIHGGLQATLADEVGAWTVIATTGNFGFTTSMQLRYVRPARHDQPPLTIPFFHNANWDARVECIVAGGEEPRHDPVLAGAHLMSKFRSTVV